MEEKNVGFLKNPKFLKLPKQEQAKTVLKTLVDYLNMTPEQMQKEKEARENKKKE